LGTACVATCNSPYYISGNICSLCYSPCLTCSADPYHCLTCITNYLLFSSKCYSPCPVGTFASTATNCALCSPPCYRCAGSASTCTACFSGSYLFNNTCYSPCPPSYFPINSTCGTCESQCASCTHTLAN
jgi:proprotein convertase subtilisin/kexin type 5